MESLEPILFAVWAIFALAILCYAWFGGPAEKRGWRPPKVIERPQGRKFRPF